MGLSEQLQGAMEEQKKLPMSRDEFISWDDSRRQRGTGLVNVPVATDVRRDMQGYLKRHPETKGMKVEVKKGEVIVSDGKRTVARVGLIRGNELGFIHPKGGHFSRSEKHGVVSAVSNALGAAKQGFKPW
jgi:hypothetical protein